MDVCNSWYEINIAPLLIWGHYKVTTYNMVYYCMQKLTWQRLSPKHNLSSSSNVGEVDCRARISWTSSVSKVASKAPTLDAYFIIVNAGKNQPT